MQKPQINAEKASGSMESDQLWEMKNTHILYAELGVMRVVTSQ